MKRNRTTCSLSPAAAARAGRTVFALTGDSLAFGAGAAAVTTGGATWSATTCGGGNSSALVLTTSCGTSRVNSHAASGAITSTATNA